jgi:hypothetical protein
VAYILRAHGNSIELETNTARNMRMLYPFGQVLACRCIQTHIELIDVLKVEFFPHLTATFSGK